MERLMQINDFINGIVWGVPVLLLILGTGLFFTVRLGFIQFRYPEGIWYMKHWWCVDGGEPSDMYLDMSRFSGVIFMIAGVICLLVGCV